MSRSTSAANIKPPVKVAEESHLGLEGLMSVRAAEAADLAAITALVLEINGNQRRIDEGNC